MTNEMMPCPECGSTGVVLWRECEAKCPTCKGAKRIRDRRVTADRRTRTPAPAGELAALAEAWVEAEKIFCRSEHGGWAEEAGRTAIAARAAYRAALAAHLAEVRAAIGPVANVAIVYEDLPDDARIGVGPNGNDITTGDLRRLAALAKKLEG